MLAFRYEVGWVGSVCAPHDSVQVINAGSPVFPGSRLASSDGFGRSMTSVMPRNSAGNTSFRPNRTSPPITASLVR